MIKQIHPTIQTIIIVHKIMMPIICNLLTLFNISFKTIILIYYLVLQVINLKFILMILCGSFIIFVLTKISKYENISYSIFINYLEVRKVIDYTPFWQTLENSEENWYTLTNKHNLSHSTLHRLKHNKDVSTKTLNDLCRILHCNIADIVQYIPSDTDQAL